MNRFLNNIKKYMLVISITVITAFLIVLLSSISLVIIMIFSVSMIERLDFLKGLTDTYFQRFKQYEKHCIKNTNDENKIIHINEAFFRKNYQVQIDEYLSENFSQKIATNLYFNKVAENTQAKRNTKRYEWIIENARIEKYNEEHLVFENEIDEETVQLNRQAIYSYSDNVNTKYFLDIIALKEYLIFLGPLADLDNISKITPFNHYLYVDTIRVIGADKSYIKCAVGDMKHLVIDEDTWECTEVSGVGDLFDIYNVFREKEVKFNNLYFNEIKNRAVLKKIPGKNIKYF